MLGDKYEIFVNLRDFFERNGVFFKLLYIGRYYLLGF